MSSVKVARDEAGGHSENGRCDPDQDDDPGPAQVAERGLAQSDHLDGDEDEEEPVRAVRAVGQGPRMEPGHERLP